MGSRFELSLLQSKDKKKTCQARRERVLKGTEVLHLFDWWLLMLESLTNSKVFVKL